VVVMVVEKCLKVVVVVIDFTVPKSGKPGARADSCDLQYPMIVSAPAKIQEKSCYF
jgi:hypothetical protein